jgi:hypothetical protein
VRFIIYNVVATSLKYQQSNQITHIAIVKMRQRHNSSKKISSDLLSLVKCGELTEFQANKMHQEGLALKKIFENNIDVVTPVNSNEISQARKRKRDVQQVSRTKLKCSFAPKNTVGLLRKYWAAQPKKLSIFDTREVETTDSCIALRRSGEPFILVGHSSFTDFADTWNATALLAKKKVDGNCIPSTLRPLQVPLTQKGKSSTSTFHPICKSMKFGEFLSKYWSVGDPEYYLHQWQFPVESHQARKLMGAKSFFRLSVSQSGIGGNCQKVSGASHLPLCMGYDMLEDWKDDLDNENPFQYIFAGAKSTHSSMHKDCGGMGIFISPICGRKEVILIHRDDGEFLKNGICTGNADINFETCPLLPFARVWKHTLVPGDVMYLPAGTYHMCRNIEACISYHRLHLDEINLPYFLRSMFQGDSVEIDHGDIIWNTTHSIMEKYSRILKKESSSLKKFQNMLLVLRQVAVYLSKRCKSKEWSDLAKDIDSTLPSSFVDKQQNNNGRGTTCNTQKNQNAHFDYLKNIGLNSL